MIKKAQVPDVW